MTCPKCNSEEWKLASMIHAGGLSKISTSTIGIGAATTGGGVGLGGGVGSTSGEQQTELSKLAAPPSKEIRPAIALIILGSITLVVGIVFFGNLSFSEYPISTNILFVIAPLVTLIASVRLLLTMDISKSIDDKHNLALLEYEKKRMCLRCGSFYFEDDQSSAPEPPISLATISKPSSSTTKKCPFCAETILVDAILCKHCHSKIVQV